MHLELLELFHTLNEAYALQDNALLDHYTDLLFAPGEDTVILGTTNGELCLGFEACKNLIKSDWSGWGVVWADVDTAEFDVKDDVAWFSVAATVKYKFTQDEATMQRFVNFVAEELKTAELGPAEGLALINWVLTHITFVREPGERVTYLPLRITGSMVRINKHWKFKYMQFSVPQATYPDQRFGTPALERLHKVRPFDLGEFPHSQQRDCLKQETELFLTQYNLGDLSSLSDSISSLLMEFREKYGELHIDLDNAVYVSQGSLHWLAASGYTHQSIEADTDLRQRMKEIANCLQQDIPVQEKLFRMQRDIAATLREVASGAERKYICRLEMAFAEDESGYRIIHVYPSFPFYWALDGKLDS